MNTKNKHNKPIVIQSEIGKFPPNDTEVEQIVLGQLMIDNLGFESTIGIISERTFYKETHQKVYLAIKSLYEKKEPINIITVTVELRRTGDIDNVGGAFFITELTTRVSSSATIQHHCKILKEHEVRRQLICYTNEIMNSSYDLNIDLTNIKESITESIKYIDDEVNSVTNNLLSECEIKLSDKIEDIQFMLSLVKDGKEYGMFSRGSLSKISGGKGSRKSFYVSMISKYLKNGIKDSYFKAEKSKVVIFDTEQSKAYSQKMLRRINEIDDERLRFFNLSIYSIKMRKSIVEVALKEIKPDFVIIDNITDFVKNINDQEEAASICSFLVRLKYQYNCGMCVVIHENKGDKNARGHIGSEIDKNIECAISINEKVESNTHSIVSFTKMRDCVKPSDDELTIIEENGINIAILDRGLTDNNKFVESKHNEYKSFKFKQANDDIEPNKDFDGDLPF